MVITKEVTATLHDLDDDELAEWRESFDAIRRRYGDDRAAHLLGHLATRARETGVAVPFTIGTPYVNTIPRAHEPRYPGNLDLERRIKSLVRWNAMAMVVRANREHPGIGGHISTFASAATLFEVGFNHFFHAPSGEHPGDIVYFQGHASPGVYARAFLEGRIRDEELAYFRREASGHSGLSSYPHPRLMPGFWQYPSVSMGLSPIMAIYQARFHRYLQDRGLCDTSKMRVWCFIGDGECDESESGGTAFTRTSASSTSRSTASRCCITARRSTGRSSRRASPRQARCRRSSPRARRTRRMASR